VIAERGAVEGLAGELLVAKVSAAQVAEGLGQVARA
jgi:hypothetical protein